MKPIFDKNGKIIGYEDEGVIKTTGGRLLGGIDSKGAINIGGHIVGSANPDPQENLPFMFNGQHNNQKGKGRR